MTSGQPPCDIIIQKIKVGFHLLLQLATSTHFDYITLIIIIR